jgi:hypothetical protein
MSKTVTDKLDEIEAEYRGELELLFAANGGSPDVMITRGQVECTVAHPLKLQQPLTYEQVVEFFTVCTKGRSRVPLLVEALRHCLEEIYIQTKYPRAVEQVERNIAAILNRYGGE